MASTTSAPAPTTNGHSSTPSTKNLPNIKNMTITNITPNTITINNQSPSPRLRFIFSRLVTHLHDFARETRLSTPEWKAALDFLVQVGQISSDVRHEFILLSDVLGLSLLIDAISHPKPKASTEGSVLGPFHTHDAEIHKNGEGMSADEEGEPLLCICKVTDPDGKPIEGVKIDIWETDSSGHYDVQHADRTSPDGRCVMLSDSSGTFWYKAIVPVSYPIPHDGPVGQLLKLLGRHPWRPAHMHFMFEKEGWDHLITALYIKGDEYINSDAVFGVKDSLVVELGEVTDEETAAKYGVSKGTKLLERTFVLVTEEETRKLREGEARKAMGELFPKGGWVLDSEGLPVFDVD